MFRNYSLQPDGREMYRLADGWAFCSYSVAISQGWSPSKADGDDPIFPKEHPLFIQEEKPEHALSMISFESLLT